MNNDAQHCWQHDVFVDNTNKLLQNNVANCTQFKESSKINCWLNTIKATEVKFF